MQVQTNSHRTLAINEEEVPEQPVDAGKGTQYAAVHHTIKEAAHENKDL